MRTRRWRPRHAAAGLAFAAVITASPAAAQESGVVTVTGNRFAPFEVAVAPTGTVTWAVQEGGHTIVADDGRFAFRGEGGSALPVGADVSFETASDAEYIAYYCEIHGGRGSQGMSGRIKVGEPPPPPVHVGPVIRVPGDQPSLAAALSVAAPGHRIEVAPGTYGIAAAVGVAVDDVTVVGTGQDPSAVTLVAAPGQRGFPTSALRVSASRVTISNLTVRGFRASGIHVHGATAALVTDVVVDGAEFTQDGILVEQVSGTTLRRTTTTGNNGAGVRITDCAACGVRLDEVRSQGNLIGVLVEGARGVAVHRASISGNGAGVVARATRSSQVARPVVITLLASDVVDNRNTQVAARATPQDRLLSVGAGVWLSGAADSEIRGNTIHGNTYGIVLAGDASSTTHVRANDLGDNTQADLAWDGLGAQTCFATNTAGGGAPTSEPPNIQSLYPCDRPTVGVPFPIVMLRLLLLAVDNPLEGRHP